MIYHPLKKNLLHLLKQFFKQRKLSLNEVFFLPLTYPNITNWTQVLKDISSDVHALELRVDLLEHMSPEFIKSQIYLLRVHSNLPIIYTVRSKDQAGKFVGNEEEMMQLLEVGLKANCEFIDVEACWSLQATKQLIKKKGNSKIIASQHAFNQPVSEENLRKMFQSCYALGDVDIIKVVGFAKEIDDVYTLQKVAAEFRSTSKLPIIAILAGEKGKLSRALNKYLTPVTHPLLPNASAPGQLTVKQSLKIRELIGDS